MLFWVQLPVGFQRTGHPHGGTSNSLHDLGVIILDHVNAFSQISDHDKKKPSPIQHLSNWHAGDYKAGEVVGGRYEMQEVIGQGSSGVTYKAGLLFDSASASGSITLALTGSQLFGHVASESDTPKH